MSSLLDLPCELIAYTGLQLEESDLCRFMRTCSKVHQSVISGNIPLRLFSANVKRSARYGKIEYIEHYLKHHSINEDVIGASMTAIEYGQAECFRLLLRAINPPETRLFCYFEQLVDHCHKQPTTVFMGRFVDRFNKDVSMLLEYRKSAIVNIFVDHFKGAVFRSRDNGLFDKHILELLDGGNLNLDFLSALLHAGVVEPDALLHDACIFGRDKVVELAYRYGANATVRRTGFGSFPLEAAVYSENPYLVRWLLEHHVDVHHEDDLALVNACNDETYHIVEILLEFGADVNAQNGMPLYTACKRHNVAIVRLLLGKGADPSLGEGRAFMALTRNDENPYPPQNSTVLCITEALLDHGIDINASEGYLFICACANAASDSNGTVELKIVQMFIDRGADVTVRDYLAFSYAVDYTPLWTILLDAVGAQSITFDMYKAFKRKGRALRNAPIPLRYHAV